MIFRWRGTDEDEVTKAAQQGVAALRRGLDQHALLLGPGPAPLARLRGHFRWQALLRGESVYHLHQQVAGALPTSLRCVERRSSISPSDRCFTRP